MAKKLNITYAIGKRKNASARVRLFHGKGENIVNEMPIEKYFPGEINKTFWSKPFDLTETADKYYVTVRVFGGGLHAQLEAVVQGIAKALSLAKKEEFRPILKKAGLLTRDSRIRQRRMVGMGGKSRRMKQSPKR
ncbi:30S ribosomal protein S9 [Patescibacteria group bacterium]|nr:30S ribosomal protein S9 [Patescibacteria group bacterium]